MITQARLKELLYYDPQLGWFIWLKPRHVSKIGAVAGTLKPSGYIEIHIGSKIYKAHRLAWLYLHGSLPAEIDHRDRIGAHNNAKNLRPATRMQNVHNGPDHKGVRLHRCGRYEARIGVAGKSKYLGLFDTEKGARSAYLAARQEHHTFRA